MSDGTTWRDHAAAYEPPKTMLVPLLAGVAVHILAVIGLRAIVGGFSGDWPTFLGMVTGAALPVPLGLWFLQMRHREPRGWWKLLFFWPLTFALLFISLPGGDGRNGPATEREIRMVQRSIAEAADQALARGTNIGPLRRSGATGEAGEVELITLEFIERTAADGRDYERALNATGFADLLDRLRRREEIPAARAKLAEARAIVDRHDRLFTQRFGEFNRRVEAADITPRTRRELLSGFQASQERSRSVRDQLWNYERRALDAYDQLLVVLARGGWTRDGQQYTFDRQADSDAFNRLLGQMQRIAADQAALQSRHNDRTRQQLDTLRRY